MRVSTVFVHIRPQTIDRPPELVTNLNEQMHESQYGVVCVICMFGVFSSREDRCLSCILTNRLNRTKMECDNNGDYNQPHANRHNTTMAATTLAATTMRREGTTGTIDRSPSLSLSLPPLSHSLSIYMRRLSLSVCFFLCALPLFL